MAVTTLMRTQVTELYVSLFGRAPEADGLGYWVSQLSAGKTIQTVAQDMFNVPAARVMYPTFLTNAEIVTKFYVNVLGRTPDADGQAYWTAQLNTKTVGTVVFDMINAVVGYTGTDAAALASQSLFNNKVIVGLHYAVDLLGNDVAVATTINGLVTATDTTAALAVADGTAVAGKTLATTLDQDVLVGTAGNDTFNALALQDNTAALKNSLQNVDSLDGGAGTDTLNVTLSEVGTSVTPTLTNLENVVARIAGAGADLNLAGSTGVTSATLAKSTAVGSISGVGAAALAVSNQNFDATFNGATGTTRTLSLDTVGTSSALINVATNFASSAAKTLALTANNAFVNLSGEAATTVTIAASGSNAISLATAGASATTLTVTGSGSVDATGSALSALKTLTVGDGGIMANITNATTGVVTVTTGAGADTISVVGDSVKSIATGDGKDSVTVNTSSLTTTSTIDLGAGDDTITFTAAANSAGATVEGGAGTDTIAMTAANATAVSATGAFEAKINGFEKVAIGSAAAFSTATVDLANLDDISYLKSAGTDVGPGTAEVASITFNSLLSGQSVTVGVTTHTAVADETAATVAAAFANAANGTYTTGAVSGSTVVFTNGVVGNVANLVPTVGAATAPTALGVNVTTQGVTAVVGVKEVSTVTFGNFAAGADTLVFDGITTTFVDGDNANAQAAAFVAANNAAGGRHWDAVNNGNGTVTLTNVATGVQTDLVNGDFVVADVAAVGHPTVTVAAPTTQGVTAVAGATEVTDITFTALRDGQSETVAGRVVTAVGGDLTAAQVAAAFAGGVNAGNAQIGGTLSGYTLGAAAGAVVTFTSTTVNTDIADLAPTVANSIGATVPAAVITDGTSLGGGGVLNVLDMGNNGTFELTGAINGASSIAMTDATGTADVLNIKLNGASNIVNTAALTVAGVETINITATDSSSVADPSAASTILLNAANATTVKVTGNHGIDFTGSTLSAVTSMDASGVVSAKTSPGTPAMVTFASTNTSAAVSIKGGNGNDLLSAAAASTKAVTIDGGAGNDTITGAKGADVLMGGAGNDTITGGNGADTLTGGTGNDTFVYVTTGGVSADSTLAVKDVITDFAANTFGNGTLGATGTGAGASANWTGDVLKFSGINGAVLADGVYTSVQTNAADAQTWLQNLASDTSVAKDNAFGAVLDSSTGNLYIDLDSDGNIDMVIQLTGVTTINAAAIVLV